MASLNLINSLVEETLHSVVNRQSPLVAFLLSKGVHIRQRQKTVEWGVNVGGFTSTGSAVGSNPPAFTGDNIRRASLPIGNDQFDISFELYRPDIIEAGERGGLAALRRLIFGNATLAMQQLVNDFEAQLIAGDGSSADGGVVGLTTAVDDTLAYAGINPATYPNYVSYVKDAASAVLTEALIRETVTEIYEAGGFFDFILMSHKQGAVYEDLFAQNRSLNYSTADGQTPVANLGFKGVFYGQYPIIVSNHCPDSDIFFLDSSTINIYTMAELVDAAGLTDNVAIQEQDGLAISTTLLANSKSNVHSFTVNLLAQMAVKSRRNTARIKNLILPA